MDAKQAIKLLNEHDTLCKENDIEYYISLSEPQAKAIAKLIESQERDAELGRTAMEAAKKQWCNHQEKFKCLPGSNVCVWREFCQLMANKEANNESDT